MRIQYTYQQIMENFHMKGTQHYRKCLQLKTTKQQFMARAANYLTGTKDVFYSILSNINSMTT